MELMVEHLAADPPSRLAMREEDDVSVFAVEYRLDRHGAATRFTQVSEFEWKRLPGSCTARSEKALSAMCEGSCAS